MKLLNLSVLSVLSTLLVACSAPGVPAQNTAAVAIKNLGCKASQSEMWNSLYRIAENESQFPSALELEQALRAAGTAQGLAGAAFENYVAAFVQNYATTIDGIRARFAPQTTAAWKKSLAEMEIGVRVTPIHAALQAQLEGSLHRLKVAETALQVSCATPSPLPTPAPSPAPAPAPLPGPAPQFANVWSQLKATTTPEVYGARKTLAVAYQSCGVLALSPMSSTTPAVQGIRDIGVRPDGGHIREIASLALVNGTDYYIAQQKLAQNSCFEIRQDPLIYNFGGKPFTTASDTQLLDLFTHTNGGGPTLGIDCSGYVFSALALAGLKLDPDPSRVLKADLVWGVGSVAFKDPELNNLRCLQKITPTANQALLAGDIGAMNGHVFMIDAVGPDPFGLGGLQSLAECTPAHVNPSHFDFVIAQSAPVKNGIGINRIRAADYMPESSTIRNGFIQYAVAACRAKFGASADVQSPDFSLIRHNKTAACLAPAELHLAHEDCVQSCPAL